MPSLLDLQRDFLAVMLRRSDPATLGRHLQQRGDLARRIGVYRTNTLENFATALGAAFPVLRAWLGPEDFRAMAWTRAPAVPRWRARRHAGGVAGRSRTARVAGAGSHGGSR